MLRSLGTVPSRPNKIARLLIGHPLGNIVTQGIGAAIQYRAGALEASSEAARRISRLTVGIYQLAIFVQLGNDRNRLSMPGKGVTRAKGIGYLQLELFTRACCWFTVQRRHLPAIISKILFC